MRRSLPPVYQPLLGGFFDRPKVVETRATCHDCAMCDHGQASPVAMDFFRRDTKCCTFWPILPNFLAGAILADESVEMAEGKRRLREKIATRIGVGAQWLQRPRKLTLIMGGYGDAFGRAESLRCPYFDASNPEGSCTIWRHREVICLTYYCKFSGGHRGYEFWDALKQYLSYVQRQLAAGAARAVDPRVVEPLFKTNSLTAEDIDDLPPKAADYEAWWGEWLGREEAFYVRCHEWVRSLSPRAFAEAIDEKGEGKRLLERVIAKYDTLEAKLIPTTLVRNARMNERHVGDRVVVTSYHRYDSFVLEKDLYDVVGLLRADETLEANLARLERDEGIALAPELVEFLFMAGVLVEPKALAAPQAERAAEIEARRAAVFAVLDARGLVLDDAAKMALEAADLGALEQLLRRAAIATTLAEVFAAR